MENNKDIIEVKYSAIIVHNYELGDDTVLEKTLSVFDKAIFDYTIRAYIYDEENKCLIIPRGFNSNYVSYRLKNKKLVYNNKCTFGRRIVCKEVGTPKNEIQEQSIDFLVGRNEFKDTDSETQKFLCLPPASGKTFCMIHAICYFKRATIVIVDSLRVINQWLESFLKFSDIKESDICVINSSESIIKLVKDKVFNNYKIYLVTHQTLNSYSNKKPEKLTNLFEKLKIGVKVYDEAHVMWENIFFIDGYTNTERTFYLTGTPGRSNANEDKLYQNCFQDVMRYGQGLKTNENYIIVNYISYNSHPSFNDQASCVARRGFNINAYYDYVFSDNKLDIFLDKLFQVVDIIMAFREKDNNPSMNKTVIMIHKNEHISILKECFEEKYPNLQVGTFCGLVSAKNKEKELEKDIILTNDKAMSKAVDVLGLRFFINTVPISSKILSYQIIYRLRKIPNKRSLYFDLTDIGFSACKNQLRYRKEIFNDVAYKIKNLSL